MQLFLIVFYCIGNNMQKKKNIQNVNEILVTLFNIINKIFIHRNTILRKYYQLYEI